MSKAWLPFFSDWHTISQSIPFFAPIHSLSFNSSGLGITWEQYANSLPMQSHQPPVLLIFLLLPLIGHLSMCNLKARKWNIKLLRTFKNADVLMQVLLVFIFQKTFSLMIRNFMATNNLHLATYFTEHT